MTDALTIGVEEEYQIVNPQTRELTGRAGQIMASAQKLLGEDEVQPEVYRSQIEIATPVCETLADVRTELSHARGSIIEAARQHGSAIAAAGTHPFSDWRDQQVTPKERYQGLVRDYQQIMRDLIIFGCHVHVGISDREIAVQVLNRSRIWLPLLLALSTNSPFWLGTETGYASYRTELWSRWPFSGPPFSFTDYQEYQTLTEALAKTEAIKDATKIYWDIRLSEHVPTVEFRFADVCMTIDEAVMITGLVRAMVQTCYREIMADRPAVVVRPELLQAARWRAARDGLSTNLIDVVNQQFIPATELLERFLAYVRPVLEELGDWQEISALVQQTVQNGTGAERQRQIFQQTGSLEQVVDYLVSQTMAGIT